MLQIHNGFLFESANKPQCLYLNFLQPSPARPLTSAALAVPSVFCGSCSCFLRSNQAVFAPFKTGVDGNLRCCLGARNAGKYCMQQMPAALAPNASGGARSGTPCCILLDHHGPDPSQGSAIIINPIFCRAFLPPPPPTAVPPYLPRSSMRYGTRNDHPHQ